MSNSAGGKGRDRLAHATVPSGIRVRSLNAAKKGGEEEEAEGQVRPHGVAHPLVLHCR